MLEAWLDFHRATLLIKCDGLTGDQLTARSVPPSGLSLLGLVRHLTEVERNWFRRTLAAETVDAVYSADGRRGGDFFGAGETDLVGDLQRFRDEVELCRSVAARCPDLDATATGVRDGQRVEVSLRWIYMHMIEEYARHNGHADLLRESVDGSTGV
ncbi:MAG: hypothetical protein QOK30_2250 [Nocardioidaceae bacterium]|jgi:uncharacterized damage-inducible protein DinB|nr:hypothetical protein [Nocardioidaceae bacterium]